MNAAKGESNVNCAGNAAPHSTNNDFTLNVESQTAATVLTSLPIATVLWWKPPLLLA
jgi:hypothetical protein